MLLSHWLAAGQWDVDTAEHSNLPNIMAASSLSSDVRAALMQHMHPLAMIAAESAPVAQPLSKHGRTELEETVGFTASV